MTKLFKNLTLFLLVVLCLTVCFGVLVACDNNKGVEYSVTVLMPDGSPASGVKVAIKKGTNTGAPKTTDNDGKVSFKLADDEYEVVLTLPHYEASADSDLKLTKENRNLTVTLAEKFAYKVTLVNVDDTPFTSDTVRVGICKDGNCTQPVFLEGNVAIIEEPKDNYHIQIVNLPSTLSYDHDENGYYTREEFTAEKTEITIKIYPVTEIELNAGNKLTEEEKIACSQSGDFYYFEDDALLYDAHKFNATLAAGETKHYSITPPYDCVYMLYQDDANYYNCKQNFLAEDGVMYMYPGFHSIELKANTTCYLNVVNNKDEEAEVSFILTAPVASYTIIDSAKTVTVTINKADTNAIIQFTPDEAGLYTATVQGEQPALLICSTSSNSVPIFMEGADPDDYLKNSSDSQKITSAQLGLSLYIGVSVHEAAIYPVKLQVKIEKAGELIDTYNTIQVEEALTRFGDQEGKKLQGVPVDGTANLVYNTTDHFYHLNAVDGPIVVVKLTSELERARFSDGSEDNSYALAYFDINPMCNAQYVVDVTAIEDKASFEKGNTYDDYRIFLRGFTKYEYDKNNIAQIPEQIAAQKYYTNFVNQDGVYPLTQELKEFLEVFYQANADLIKYCTNNISPAADCEWLFPCYYYVEGSSSVTPEPVENDAIVGEYKLVSFTEMFDWQDENFASHREKKTFNVGDVYREGFDDEEDEIVLIDRYSLKITKDGFEVIQPSPRGDVTCFSGEWTKNNDGTYTLSDCQDNWEMPITATVSFDSATNKITFVFVQEDMDENYELAEIEFSYVFQKA